MQQKRVQFDFAMTFTNGGGIQGQGFRLDIAGEAISDRELADYLVQDMRLLMVGEVEILNKTIIAEPHKRSPMDGGSNQPLIVDLSHSVGDDRQAPAIASAEPVPQLESDSIPAATHPGTSITCLSPLALPNLINLPGIVVRAQQRTSRAIDKTYFVDKEIRGRAVLVDTGWDTHWNTGQYGKSHPFLTEDAARYLQSCGIKLVAIASPSIDATDGAIQPVRAILLAAGIPVVECLCDLQSLPDEGFAFSVVPLKFAGGGMFPVRAFAQLQRR